MKSGVAPARMTLRGPADWGRRGAVRFAAKGHAEATSLVVCEGVEDALSLMAAGCPNVAAILGISRLGKIVWPLSVRTIIVARDGDPPGSPGDNALYRGVTRQRGAGLTVRVAPRPHTIAPDAGVPPKDVNDLHQLNPELVRQLVAAPAAGSEDLGEEARNAVLDEVSRMSIERYDLARLATSKMLGFSRVKALDDARAARIAERIAAASAAADEEDEAVWPEPVTNIGEVLDEMAHEVSRYVKAPATAIDAVVLWDASAHILQRSELGIIISPRLYIQSPVPNCGKTTLLEIVMVLTPRSQMVSSTSVSGLFREDSRQEADMGLRRVRQDLARRLARAPRHPRLRTPSFIRLCHPDDQD